MKHIIFNGFKTIFYICWFLKLNNILGLYISMLVVFFNGRKKISSCRCIFFLERSVSVYDVEILKKHSCNSFLFITYPELLRSMFNDEAYVIKQNGLGSWIQIGFYKDVDNNSFIYNHYSDVYTIVLKLLEKFYDVDIVCVLAGNFSYYQEYSWIDAVHRIKGRYIAFCKESIFLDDNSIDECRFYIDKYGFSYDGDLVFFYNEHGRDVYIKYGYLTKDKCRVVGCPRVDELVDMVSTDLYVDKLVLLSFFNSWYYSSNMFFDILDFFNDKNNVIIKCKTTGECNILKKSYPNFIYTTESLVDVLKKKPKAVIGFNTTGIFEAFISKTPIVVPCWGDAYVFNVFKKYVNANNLDEFSFVLENIDRIDNYDMKDVIEKYFSLMDGCNCMRFFNEVEKVMI